MSIGDRRHKGRPTRAPTCCRTCFLQTGTRRAAGRPGLSDPMTTAHVSTSGRAAADRTPIGASPLVVSAAATWSGRRCGSLPKFVSE